MISPKLPINEHDRLNALLQYDILDTPEEQAFDDLVKLASQICATPISLVTLVDTSRQWFKAKVGLAIQETSREMAFCSYAIHSDEMMIVRDTHEDKRFVNNPLVLEAPKIRFYAGMPLVSPEGYRLGTLCVIDSVPRELTEHQLFAIEVLSRQVVQHLELKRHLKSLGVSYKKIYDQHNALKRSSLVSNKLMSIISHDLSGPMTTMKGFLNLFQNNQLSHQEILQFSKGISKLIDSSSSLLDNLLQWGLSQIEQEGLRIKQIRLDTTILEVISHLQLPINYKNNHIIYEMPENCELMADVVMIRFILRNLIQNANKFTENGTIEIYVVQDAEEYTISIKDNGVGIEEERLSELLKWDMRVSTRGTFGEKGAGLGLLICKEFIDKHRGKIHIESKTGKGSIFSFTISKHL